MAFSESVKATVRRRAHIRCCVCHSFLVDVHHIVPQSEGGLDTEDNAAPLCPSCHEIYGADARKRKLVREARDLWFDLCSAAGQPEPGQLSEIAEALRDLPTKADLERLAVRNVIYTLGPFTGEREPDSGRYSFVAPEFIHPLVVRELLGCLSDPSETVLAVDLLAANQSSRFFGDYSVHTADGRVWVKFAGPAGESFVYGHIATSPSGVEMVECIDCGGGSGVFGTVGLFAIEADRALGQDPDGKVCTRTRVVLKSLGSIVLGDRYAGSITYGDGLLLIGPDVGWFNRGERAAKAVPVL
jgi:hypothetical protein